MPLNTTPVAGYLYDPSGAPLANTPVQIRLTRPEIEDNVVVPEVITATTDEAGLLSVLLWPNTRGTAGSQYRLTIKQWGMAGERKAFDRLFTVPESVDPLNLADLFDSDPPDTVSTGAALRAAQEAEDALAAVQALADATAADRTTVQVLAAETANNATSSLTAVSQSVAAAEEAGNQADEATVQAALAAQHAANAAASVLQVAGIADDVEVDRLAAEAAATTAVNAAAVSGDARDLAVDAALDAFQNAVGAQLAQINAEAAELAALGHATGAQLALLGAEAERLAAELAALNASADAGRAESAAAQAEASQVAAENAAQASIGAVGDAEAAANIALGYLGQTQTARDEAEDARDAAELSAQAAEAAEAATAADRLAVEAAAAASLASSQASELSAQAAANSEDNAAVSAADAAMSAISASSSANTAVSAAAAALVSEDNAQASATQAAQSALVAFAAAGLAGITITRKEAISAAYSAPKGSLVKVLNDEAFGGRSTIYMTNFDGGAAVAFDFIGDNDGTRSMRTMNFDFVGDNDGREAQTLSFDMVNGQYGLADIPEPTPSTFEIFQVDPISNLEFKLHDDPLVAVGGDPFSYEASIESPFNTTSTTFVEALNVTAEIITARKIRVSASVRVEKLVSGFAEVLVFIDGAPVNASLARVDFGEGSDNVALLAQVSVSPGERVVSIRLRSNDGEVATIHNAFATVQETF